MTVVIIVNIIISWCYSGGAVIFWIKHCLINAETYTRVRFSPDVDKNGWNMLLRRAVR